MNAQNATANHLINENSPYLLQHAYNPVEWYPWGQEALQKAKDENKMLIISIGYAACHWCHVMEHESYEDSLVASIMNEHFINIKVDREERPDIDDIYMTACHLSNNRSCGWPLNAFALPDGRPVWAGTYFPKDQWIRLLKQFIDFQKTDSIKLENAAKGIMEGMHQMEALIESDNSNPLTEEMLNKVHGRLTDQMDLKKGGRSGQPKFPLPNIHQFYLQYYDLFKNDLSIKVIESSLDNMAMGGIVDHLGGGFARYSTDQNWFAPHFEKMLYDNAQLVSLYAEAFQLTGKDLYKETLIKILDFVDEELSSDEGAFYSSLDADSEGLEGKYYVWTYEELKSLVKDEKKLDLFVKYYNIEKKGNWEHGSNILFIKEDITAFAKKLKLSESEVKSKILEISGILLEERSKRIKPGLDDKIITSWNGLMIKAYSDSYKAVGRKEYLDKALSCANFYKNNIILDDFRMGRSYKNGSLKINAFLDDYASMIDGFIALYEVSFDEDWLFTAKGLMDYAILHFYSENDVKFYYTSDLDPKLITRKTEWTDNVIPGSVSMMAKNLFILSEFFSDSEYRHLSENLLAKILPTLERTKDPSYYSNWLSLALYFYQPPKQIVIIGPKATEFKNEIMKEFLPNAILLGSKSEGAIELTHNKLIPDKTMIYVCQDKICKLPVDNIKAAILQLQ